MKNSVHFNLDSLTFKKILAFAFPIYLLTLTWFLFIAVDSVDRSDYFMKREVHIVPFKATYMAFEDLNNGTYPISDGEIKHYRYLLIRNIAGNIVLFVPWGFMVSFLFENFSNIKRFLASTLFLCFFIEAIQYVFILGVADIDDVVYNMLGAVLGFYLLQLLKQYGLERNNKY